MNDVVRIGELELYPAALEVRGPAGVQRLEPRAAAVLERLAQVPGEVVARDELIQSVWGHPHVSKDTLAVTVHRLRHALSEAGGPGNGEGPVETVPRRGYRLRLPEQAAAWPPGRRWRLAAGFAAAGLALSIAFALSTVEPQTPPDGPVATLARAEALWERREPGAARRAVALAGEVAASAEATSEVTVRAHALLGRFYGYKTAHWLGLEREEAARLGRRHLERAVAAAPRDPEVLTAAAGFALYTERDAGRAFRLAEEALALDPERAATRQVYAKAAAAAGDPVVALKVIQDLGAEVPADGGVQWDRAFILFLARRHQESLAAAETASALTGRDLYWLEAFNHHAMGRHDEAARVWADHLRRNGCAVSLARETARSFRNLLEAGDRCGGGFDYHRGLWALYGGRVNLARQYFDTARAQGDYMYIWQEVSPLPTEVAALAWPNL